LATVGRPRMEYKWGGLIQTPSSGVGCGENGPRTRRSALAWLGVGSNSALTRLIVTPDHGRQLDMATTGNQPNPTIRGTNTTGPHPPRTGGARLRPKVSCASPTSATFCSAFISVAPSDLQPLRRSALQMAARSPTLFFPAIVPAPRSAVHTRQSQFPGKTPQLPSSGRRSSKHWPCSDGCHMPWPLAVFSPLNKYELEPGFRRVSFPSGFLL